MAQLYAQQDRQPDVWVMSGAPSATVVYLSLPTTVNYSDGASDTLPANTPAAIVGGGTSFNRTDDVYVPFVYKGDPTLRIIKESLLPTLTSDYHPMARVELHGIKPYQPEPYLVAGGGGTAPTTTYPAIVSAAGSERVLSTPDATLSSEPASWWLPAFDDSGWATSVASGTPGDPGAAWGELTLPDGAISITDTDTSRANGVYLFVRRTFSLPAAPIISATLQVKPDSYLDQVWVNGTSCWSEVGLDNSTNLTYEDVTENIDVASLLLPGASNVIALRDRNGWRGGSSNPVRVVYHLGITVNAGGGIPAPSSPAEGDLLYYHGGAWVDLPIGTSGQVLKSNGADPGWAAAAAGTVTSVAFTGPTGTTVSGSPITSSGTITLSWASQSANTFLGAPSGSSGAPTFRVLVGADIPVDASTIISSAGTIKGNYQAGSGISISGNTISASGGGGSGTVTSVALTVPGIFSLSGSPITTSGTLAVSLANESANQVFAGPSSGSAAAPTFRALAAADLPAAAAAGGHVHAHGHFI